MLPRYLRNRWTAIGAGVVALCMVTSDAVWLRWQCWRIQNSTCAILRVRDSFAGLRDVPISSGEVVRISDRKAMRRIAEFVQTSYLTNRPDRDDPLSRNHEQLRLAFSKGPIISVTESRLHTYRFGDAVFNPLELDELLSEIITETGERDWRDVKRDTFVWKEARIICDDFFCPPELSKFGLLGGTNVVIANPQVVAHLYELLPRIGQRGDVRYGMQHAFGCEIAFKGEGDEVVNVKFDRLGWTDRDEFAVSWPLPPGFLETIRDAIAETEASPNDHSETNE